MSKYIQDYPRVKGDRRRRSRSRSDYSDRRTTPRYDAGFPVKVYVGSGKDERVYNVTAKDVSEGGVLLENVDIPENETRIRMEFEMPDGTMPEEFHHGKFQLEGNISYANKNRKQAGVTFKETLGNKLRRVTWQYLRLMSVATLFLTFGMFLVIKSENVYFFWFDIPVFVYSLSVGMYLITRFIFAFFYAPPAILKVQDEDLPSVTIVIPSYNEEDQIERTLVQAMEVGYPDDKIQFIAVNDGSSDHTLEVMQKVRKKYPELVVIDFSENRGKRAAMAAGARMSKGEVLVYVDSDSFLQPDSVRRIVEGFADDRIGGICGQCDVENAWKNSLTKMQAVRYYISYRVMKAAESFFDAVTCLSGPLAAYRRDRLMEVLDKWEHQTYMGKQATFGDDRSLTNYILKRYKVIYDSRSLTSTIVPETYPQFFKQQMRWKRSWFRESMRAASFMWMKQPFMSLSFYLGFLLPLLAPVVVLRALVYLPLVMGQTPFTYIFGIFIMSTLMSSTYLMIRRSKLWVYSIHFCFFYMFILIWQLPFALFSFWITGWGTRGSESEEEG